MQSEELLPTIALLALLAVAIWKGVKATGLLGKRPFSLEGKVVVITGAGSGIGRRLAQKLFAETKDVTLALLDIDLASLKRLQAELLQPQGSDRPKSVLVFQCDVADLRYDSARSPTCVLGRVRLALGAWTAQTKAECIAYSDSATESCIARLTTAIAPKHIGVLVNNAGKKVASCIVTGRPLEDLTPEQIQKTFAVNTLAHFWTVKAALPSMKKASEALLVTVSSVMGMTSSAGLTDYCASKAADCIPPDHIGSKLTVRAPSHAAATVRLELWRDNVTSIRTLLVCPAAVDTGMFKGVLAADDWAVMIARMFIPMLSESEVVEAIYRAMRRGDQLLVSCFSGWRGIVLSWAPALSRLLPVPLYDLVVRLGGGVNGMDTFVGKQGSTAETSSPEDPRA
ncbi:hypothetical protein BBJ28_00000606 [Nothophytophthora sp. Chile5]|nr:hypothetical protein BBJ28_00000606 [Nothophytophthora sp. Chile5]